MSGKKAPWKFKLGKTWHSCFPLPWADPQQEGKDSSSSSVTGKLMKWLPTDLIWSPSTNGVARDPKWGIVSPHKNKRAAQKWNKQITNVRHIWYIIKIYEELAAFTRIGFHPRPGVVVTEGNFSRSVGRCFGLCVKVGSALGISEKPLFWVSNQ